MWPFDRWRKRKPQSFGMRVFKGAMGGRTVADWITSSTSMDAEINASLPRLRDRSRQLTRDNDYVQSAQRTIVNNVVGQGIGMQSQVRMKRGKGNDGKGKLNDAINNQIEAAWEKWKRKENCHTAGKLCFSDIERLIVASLFESGEVLIRVIPQKFGSSKIPLALEIIESDLLDEGYNDKYSDGRVVRMGVEMDQWRRPVAYWFKAKHPGDAPMSALETVAAPRKRIPAGEIKHLFITKRVDQTRGVPWLHSAIIRLHHMQGYEESEVIAARATSSLMGFIESPEGEPSIKDDTDAGQSVTEFEPGIFKALAPGEKVNIPNLGRPGGQLDPFMRFMLRGVAAGVGVSYESISRDYSQSNYSSSRLALLDDRDNWRVLQGWLIENFHQPLFEQWLDMAILAGQIPAKDYELNPDAYNSPRWMPRGWSWVDPAKEVQAYKDAVRCGFMTVSEVVAQSGGDYEDMIVLRKRELDHAAANDVVLDTDPAQVSGNGKPAATEAPEPATAPAE